MNIVWSIISRSEQLTQFYKWYIHFLEELCAGIFIRNRVEWINLVQIFSGCNYTHHWLNILPWAVSKTSYTQTIRSARFHWIFTVYEYDIEYSRMDWKELDYYLSPGRARPENVTCVNFIYIFFDFNERIKYTQTRSNVKTSTIEIEMTLNSTRTFQYIRAIQ